LVLTYNIISISLSKFTAGLFIKKKNLKFFKK